MVFAGDLVPKGTTLVTPALNPHLNLKPNPKLGVPKLGYMCPLGY